MDTPDVEALRDKYLNKLVFVVIKDPYTPIANLGRVLSVDDVGHLHGTWGYLPAIPGIDQIELL